MVYMTPSTPPIEQAANVSQNGTFCHQPMMIRPGSTKMTDDKVPAAEAMV